MARNPYDRRRGDERRPGRDADGGIFGYAQAPQRSTVEFEDLEAMVGQAVFRGRREAQARVVAQIHDARREAWAEGHEIGASDGRMELRGWFDERFADEIMSAVGATREILSQSEQDARKVTKGELVERCARLANLLADVLTEYCGREA